MYQSTMKKARASSTSTSRKFWLRRRVIPIKRAITVKGINLPARLISLFWMLTPIYWVVGPEKTWAFIKGKAAPSEEEYMTELEKALDEEFEANYRQNKLVIATIVFSAIVAYLGFSRIIALTPTNGKNSVISNGNLTGYSKEYAPNIVVEEKSTAQFPVKEVSDMTKGIEVILGSNPDYYLANDYRNLYKVMVVCLRNNPLLLADLVYRAEEENITPIHLEWTKEDLTAKTGLDSIHWCETFAPSSSAHEEDFQKYPPYQVNTFENDKPFAENFDQCVEYMQNHICGTNTVPAIARKTSDGRLILFMATKGGGLVT